MRFRFLTLFLFLVAAEAFGVVVVRTWPHGLVGFTKDHRTAWGINDYFCAVESPAFGEPRPPGLPWVACGQVIRNTNRGFIVSVHGKVRALKIGDRLEVDRVNQETYYNSGLIDLEYRDPRNPLSQRAIGVGIDMLSPYFSFEQGISRHFAAGFTPRLLLKDAGDGVLRENTYFLTMNYFSKRLFDGFWSMLGMGIYFARARVGGESERLRTFALNALVGWRFKFDFKMTLGFGIGGEYVFRHELNNVRLHWGGFLPVAVFQLGYAF